jgi:K+-transporting ATPase ATPase A chain
MGFWSLLQYALFLLVVAVLVKPVGGYLARVFSREKTFLDPVLRPVELAYCWWGRQSSWGD